jgi:hypothetical protein
MKKVRALWSYVAHVLSPCRRNTSKLSGLLILIFDIFFFSPSSIVLALYFLVLYLGIFGDVRGAFWRKVQFQSYNTLLLLYSDKTYLHHHNSHLFLFCRLSQEKSKLYKIKTSTSLF